MDLVRRYREMSLHPEADSAIEDIVNEAIVSDSNDVPVQIDLSNLSASDSIKKKIRSEFKYNAFVAFFSIYNDFTGFDINNEYT